MEVREITNKSEYQQFVDSAKPHTFLSSWNWGEFEASLGRPVFRLGVFQESALIAVAIFSKTTARRGTFLLCHHGPVVDPKFVGSTKEILQALKIKSVEIAKTEKCDFVRFSPIQTDTAENRQLFKELGFRNSPIHVHSELSWLVDVTQSDEEILRGMKKNTRYAIRKAEKDEVEVVVSDNLDDFEKFWAVYIETAKRQKFTPYSHAYLYNEFKIFLADKQAVLFFGMYKGEIIATAFIIYTANSGFYHHGASVQKFSGISAAELVQWKALQEAKRRGCREYNFWGVVAEDAVKHPWYGLSRFKRGFGGCEEPHVHAQDLPLRPKYWLTFAVEYIRKMRRGV